MTKDTEKAEPKKEATPAVTPAYFLPEQGITVEVDSAEAAAKLVNTKEDKE